MQKKQNTNSSSDEENSAFADILGCIVTYTSAWYRHIVKYMYSDL